jgi:hypothetical protein
MQLLGCLQDDEAQLLAELARIKAERAEEAAKAAAEAAKKAEDDVRAEVGSLPVSAMYCLKPCLCVKGACPGALTKVRLSSLVLHLH